MSWVVDDNGNGFLMRGLKDQRCWTQSGFVLAVPVLVSLFRPTGSEQGYLLFGYFTPAKFLRFLAGCRFGDGQTVFLLFRFGLIAVACAAGLPFPVVFAGFRLRVLAVGAGELAFWDWGALALAFLGWRTVITTEDSKVRSL